MQASGGDGRGDVHASALYGTTGPNLSAPLFCVLVRKNIVISFHLLVIAVV